MTEFREEIMYLAKNEEIFLTALVVIALTLIWLGVTLAGVKELLDWYILG